jgi:hypothetical protein
MRQKSGYIYVIGPIGDTPVKIGCSVNPDSRLVELQQGNPDVLKVIWRAYVEDMHTSEVRMHALLSNDRIRGEWFRRSDQLVDVIGWWSLFELHIRDGLPLRSRLS